MFIEQDLRMKEMSRVGMVGIVEASIKRVGSSGWKKLWKIPNKIVNAGLGVAAKRLISDTPKTFKYGAIGIGTTSATDTDTACESQILTRVKSTVSTDSTAVFEDTAKWVTSFTSDTTSYAVTEYATCETASGVPILSHISFAAITLNLNDVLEFSHTVQSQEA